MGEPISIGDGNETEDSYLHASDGVSELKNRASAQYLITEGSHLFFFVRRRTYPTI